MTNQREEISISSSPDNPPTAPLYSQIKADLLAAIQREQYQPGSRLPSEHALCARYQVSRNTVRQALNELLRAEVIYKEHGRGTFVAKPRPFRDVAVLEGLSEALTAQGHRVENRLQGFRTLLADAHLAQQLGVAEGSQVAEIARLRQLDGRPVSHEITYCERALGERLVASNLNSRDILVILEEDIRLLISHADVHLSAVGATAEQAELLEVPAGEPLLRTRRQVFSPDDQPLLFELLFLRGDSLDYQMRVSRSRR